MPGLPRRRCARVGQAIASFALVAGATESMMATVPRRWRRYIPMIGMVASFQLFNFPRSRAAQSVGAIHSFHRRGEFGFYLRPVVAKTIRVSLFPMCPFAHRPTDFSQL
jgi:hypothetical protein